MGKVIDLTGQRFGRLTVICRADDYISSKGKRALRWKCLCDCQLVLPEEERKYVYILGNSLRKNNGTRSCGCLQREVASKIMKEIKSKNNIYDLESQDYGLCYNEEMTCCWKFDKEDYYLIKDFYWNSNDGYARATDVKNKCTIQMHRLIMGCERFDDTCVDHINHDIFDNRKCNLRICTNFQNNANKGLREDNSSGVSGVVLDKRTNNWIAQILIDRKHIHLGVFKDKNDAIKARKEAEQKYYGEYSYDNSLKLIKEVC